LGEEFSDDEAAADIMLDMDRVARGTQRNLKPIRWYSKRWAWSYTRAYRAFSGRPGQQEHGYERDPVEPWIKERALEWRAFYVVTGNNSGKPGNQPGIKKQRSRGQKEGAGQTRESTGNNSAISTEQTTDNRKTERDNARAKPDVDLPDYIDRAVWDDWTKHRSELRKPLKATTIRYQLKQLTKFHADGHDANDIIKTSITQGWVGLFEPKPDVRGTAGTGASSGSVPGGVRGRSARQTAGLSNADYLRASGLSEDKVLRITGGSANDSGQRSEDKLPRLPTGS